MLTRPIEYFNKTSSLGCVSTRNNAGKVNAAYFSSPQMTDDETITMYLDKDRAFAYLQENLVLIERLKHYSTSSSSL